MTRAVIASNRAQRRNWTAHFRIVVTQVSSKKTVKAAWQTLGDKAGEWAPLERIRPDEVALRVESARRLPIRLAYYNCLAEIEDVMSLPPLVTTIVDAYLDALDTDAPGLITGLYLTGSAALNDFRPRTSDIDFVAVDPMRRLSPHSNVYTLVSRAGGHCHSLMAAT
jgi:hypothetical protein